jgi:RHH-type proline utilization regulon transcriptional repressor/proline dehydrogenase/delta 1-pyrroline-5-carboxylate dehydrogenase
VTARLRQLALAARGAGAAMCIDMEMRAHKPMTLEVFRRLRADPALRDWPHLAVTLQAYLRETPDDLQALLDWARRGGLPLTLRLVKGAYWDAEVAAAGRRDRPVPVYASQAETDAAFERLLAAILSAGDLCRLACATHSVRSVAVALARAQAAGLPAARLEFQALYGMAEPCAEAVLAAVGRLRLYCPVGGLAPGAAYMVRRLVENTAPGAFLRRAFIEGAPADALLAAPHAAPHAAPAQANELPGAAAFRNEPDADWTLPHVRDAARRALEKVRGGLGRTWPLHVGGRDVETADLWDSANPARPAEVVGRVCQAGPAEVESAVAAADDAPPAWRDAPPDRRAALLRAAAELARVRLPELAAWEVLECAKPWDEAWADVTEAIDYLEYYAADMLRLAAPRALGSTPGETDDLLYQGKGVAVVIAPWNFPLAISCGMSAAAIVAGNTVVYKPSEHSPVIGRLLADLFREAGAPPGVFNYVPGRREIIGDRLTSDPRVAVIAFTGSAAVGLHVVRTAAETPPGQGHVKRVIAEMGGKNAIIVDDDADLDEAVPGVLASAFGYAGQKCSACSRVIVTAGIRGRFLERLVEAARGLPIGSPEDPATAVGPLISAAAKEKVLGYVDLAAREGRIVYKGTAPAGDGHYAPLVIADGIRPEHRLAREEVFGPVLAVMQVDSFDQALEWALAAPFALTGGVFSRSPAHLDAARRRFRVGNLYLNRGCTGAKVGRQPFGGFGLSGVGSKAGGPDYLLQFLDPRTVTENTLRRGVLPAAE